MTKKKSKIRLRNGANVGELAAEDDALFLNDCFVNHPAIESLVDVRSHQSLLLGRTGSGKSAVLLNLEAGTEGKVTRIDPKEVAFQYISNSPIIKQLTDVGVDLHLLYEYLWSHVLALHFVRECMGIKSKEGFGRMVESIRNLVWRDEKRKVAVRYLEQHENDFWITVEQVSADFTDAVVNKLAAELGLSPAAFKSRIESGEEWREEQKRQFRFRGQEAVSAIQMRDLKEVINALAAEADPRQKYYILIDDLDREWAGDDNTQYALIKSLIDVIKTFRRIGNLKIIVAMREDLYEATLKSATAKHFQAEKYDGLIKRLRWTDEMLVNLIERRVNQLFKYEYTKQSVGMRDILPSAILQVPIRDYIIDKTLRRPRDLIAFVNRVLSDNEGASLPLPARAVTKSEPVYSAERLRALEDEWRSCHPLVKAYLKAVQGLATTNSMASLDENRMFALIYEINELTRDCQDDVERIGKTVYERDKALKIQKLARVLVATLYKFGVVGVKLSATQTFTFSYEHRATIEDGEINDDSRFTVHPMLVPALGINPSNAKAA